LRWRGFAVCLLCVHSLREQRHAVPLAEAAKATGTIRRAYWI
jgi:hypothetical protein